MKILSLVFAFTIFISTFAYAHQNIAPHVSFICEGMTKGYLEIGDEEVSIGEALVKLGGIPVSEREMKKYFSGFALDHITLTLYRTKEPVKVFTISPKDLKIWKESIKNGDFVVISRDPFYWVGLKTSNLIPEIPKPNKSEMATPRKPSD